MNELAKDLAESLKTGLLGMGITLISLYVLSLILDFMKVIFYKGENKQKTGALNKTIPQKETLLSEKNRDSEENEEDLIAVITAALAAYLKRPKEQIRIGFIRRIHEKTPAWGMESRLNPME